MPYQQVHNIEHVRQMMSEADPYVTSILELLINSHSVLAREIFRNAYEKNLSQAPPLSRSRMNQGL
jgi:hypothetical protein